MTKKLLNAEEFYNLQPGDIIERHESGRPNIDRTDILIGIVVGKHDSFTIKVLILRDTMGNGRFAGQNTILHYQINNYVSETFLLV